MFLDRFLISNCWNALLICVMLFLKKALRNRVTLRFQFYSWYVLITSLLLPFLPSRVFIGWSGSVLDSLETIDQYAVLQNTAASAANVSQGIQSTAHSMAQNAESLQVGFVFLLVWIVGSIAFLSFCWCGNHKLRQIRLHAELTSAEIQSVFDSCCKKLRIKKRICLLQSKSILIPVSFGLWKPIVILPTKRVDDLSRTELEHILLHELTHICHRDVRTNYVCCFIHALYWFNPFVWLAFEQMRKDREVYCDWSVLNEFTSETERITYGQTILDFAVNCNTGYYTANGLCLNRKQLKYRLESISCFKRDTKLRKICGHFFCAFLAIVSLVQIPVFAVNIQKQNMYYNPQDMKSISVADWSDCFFNADGCAVIYDLNDDQYTVYNEAEITHRVPACSTYKIYSALNALEQGIITPSNNLLQWDGTSCELPSWEQSHDLYSAMQQSVNWYFQTLDQMSGDVAASEFYQAIEYGCEADCNTISNDQNGSSIRISALEQVDLLVKLYRNDFEFNDENITAIKEAIKISNDGNFTIYGKTGTGRINSTNIAGWYIGFCEQPDNIYFFAVYLCSENGAEGATAVQVTSNILNRLGILNTGTP